MQQKLSFQLMAALLAMSGGMTAHAAISEMSKTAPTSVVQPTTTLDDLSEDMGVSTAKPQRKTTATRGEIGTTNPTTLKKPNVSKNLPNWSQPEKLPKPADEGIENEY